MRYNGLLPDTISASRPVESSSKSTIIQESLTESTILELQDIFLTNGFHQINVSSIEQGRSLLYTFLDSLGIYQDVACLTAIGTPLRPDITDISSDLFDSGCLDSSENYLEEFFIEQWYYDFMWIEATSDLLATPWVDEIKSKIINLKIDRQIPIIEIFT